MIFFASLQQYPTANTLDVQVIVNVRSEKVCCAPEQQIVIQQYSIIATCYRPPATDHLLQTTCYRPSATDHLLQTISFYSYTYSSPENPSSNRLRTPVSRGGGGGGGEGEKSEVRSQKSEGPSALQPTTPYRKLLFSLYNRCISVWNRTSLYNRCISVWNRTSLYNRCISVWNRTSLYNRCISVWNVFSLFNCVKLSVRTFNTRARACAHVLIILQVILATNSYFCTLHSR